MPVISYLDFGGGLDRRLPVTVQDASRLWKLRNAYITTGKKIAKRPGLSLVYPGVTGTLGLKSASDQLTVFVETGDAIPSVPGITVVQLDVPVVGTNLISIRYAEMFQGYLYVVGEHYKFAGGIETRVFQHHYIDGAVGGTKIADAPQSASVTKAASRVFSSAGDVVKYCAAGAARDWTTASDAGFLPSGLQQDTKTDATGVGTFQDSLAVFYPESIQVWSVAVDPSANAIKKRIYGVGTEVPESQAGFASDLAFLSPFGFRSMTVSQTSDRIDDTDLGVPVDPLVVADLAAYKADPSTSKQPLFGCWIPQLGQYWAVIPTASGSKVWAYSYSRSSKLACWSEYTFPINITGITTLRGTVYVRDADNIYKIDAASFTDAGTPIGVEVQMAFQDAKLPGVSKQFFGADLVVAGSADFSLLYDPRDLEKESIPQTLSGDTRPGDLVPVEIVATSVAPVFRHAADEAFELASISLYFNSLGPI